MYHIRTSPPPDDASRGWVASSPTRDVDSHALGTKHRERDDEHGEQQNSDETTTRHGTPLPERRYERDLTRREAGCKLRV
jgi:hypothetical protein